MAEHDFTPELVESDLVVTRAPIYFEESGSKRSKPSRVTLVACAQCGAKTLEGKLNTGELVIVEPDVATYALVWLSGEPHPVLLPGRGYPRHVCRSVA